MPTSRKRNIEIEFLVDDKRATKSLQNIEGQVTKTGKAFSTAGKLLASGLVADKIVDFGRDSVRAFMDLNESLNAVEVTFGGAAQGIKQLGEEAAESLGLSNAEFNSLAVGFSAFAEEIARGSNSTVIPVMDSLTTRIADFASVMNIDVAEAAEKFRSGLAGETEPLRKFGIDVSAAAVNQQALAMGLGDASGKLSEQDKILARYNLIMAQTEKTAGDFANTSDDLANSLRISNARLEDFKARAGEELAPAVEKGVQAATNLFDALDEDVNLGWSQRLSAAVQTLLGESEESVEAYIEQKSAINDLADAADEVEYPVPTQAQLDAAGKADEKFFAMAETMGDLAENTDDAATAQQHLTDIQKEAADPAFKLFNALDKYDEAQRNYTKAVDEFGVKSDEAEEAAIDLATAQLHLNEAGADFSAEGGAASVEALVEILEQAGVATETILGIVAAIETLNDTPIDRKSVFVPGVGDVTPGTGGTVGGGDTAIGFAHGGIVPGPLGAPVPATVHGGEMVLNRDQQKQLLKGNMGGGSVANITFVDVGVTTLAELQELYARQ